jgi:capsular polysaccharide biosynthesis protein
MITLNEFSMFVAGVIWGIFIIKPLYDIGTKIYKNAKENSK